MRKEERKRGEQKLNAPPPTIAFGNTATSDKFEKRMREEERRREENERLMAPPPLPQAIVYFKG